MNKNNSFLIKYKMVAVLVLALLPLLSFGQESNLGNWLIYIGNKKVDTKWNIHHEIQYRNYNAVGDLEQLLLRTGLGYNLADNANLLMGYGFIRSENYVDASDNKTVVNEHRIYQQLINKVKVGLVGLQHRYRFEQRFVSEEFKVRFRYFLGIAVPLNFKADSDFYLSAYNEVFLNSTESVFDRNRTYAGLGYKFSKSLKMEVGYMNQFFSTAGRDQVNLILFGSF